MVDEGEQGQRGDRRRDARHDDLEEDQQLGGAVDARGIDQVVRYAGDELAHQEDAEGVGEVGQDDAGQAGAQAERADHPVERDQRDDRRQEHGGDQQREQRAAAAEPVFGKGVAGHHAGQQDAGRGDRGDDQRVPHGAADIDHAGDLLIGVEVRRARDPDRRHLHGFGGGLQAGQHHPHQRERRRRR